MSHVKRQWFKVKMLELFVDGGLTSGVVLNKKTITCIGVYFELFVFTSVFDFQVFEISVFYCMSQMSQLFQSELSSLMKWQCCVEICLATMYFDWGFIFLTMFESV
jgi:hypothetical protein